MVSTTATLVAMLFSVLVPQKMWFNPQQALTVNVKADKDVTLELTDFSGKVIEPKGSADVGTSKDADIKQIFPQTASPGTYVLYALPKGATPSKSGPPADFLGTPLVIEVLPAPVPDAQGQVSAMVTHVVPLEYVVMTTQSGPMTEAFYYESAPHTVSNFLMLSAEGYYDGTVFHRVHPGFVIQGGDPLGTDPDAGRHGMGGPGFNIGAEFNDKPHLEGVLSMARSNDPNSAGSQFFVCLDYSATQQLDHQYTAFGKVVEGMDTVKAIASAPVKDETPDKPVMITKVDVLPVTAQKNPYTSLMSPK
jgi:peptidyl-prolyl cis-trans isomerase B (cyclophilin B)